MTGEGGLAKHTPLLHRRPLSFFPGGIFRRKSPVKAGEKSGQPKPNSSSSVPNILRTHKVSEGSIGCSPFLFSFPGLVGTPTRCSPQKLCVMKGES